MDMVCVKTSESNHDFLNDEIQTYEKDWFLYAKNTTLWADNGIWIALAMTSIDFESHPKMELVFTIDEEAWMSWVFWLDYWLLSWTKIINLDSEDENEICISSAWWIWILGNKKIERENWIFEKYEVEIFWMLGWHSWVEIDKNRWNAILVALDFLNNFEENFELYDVNSWYASNVIPSKIKLILWISDINIFEEKLKKHLENVKNIYDCPNIDFKITKAENDLKSIKNAKEIIKNLVKIKDWIYKMSEKIDSLVETSMNFWILKIEENILKITYLLRSSNNEDLKNIFENTTKYLKENWFEVENDRWYLWWQDDPASELLKIAKNEFKKVLWVEPKVIAVHAWLECWSLVAWLNKPNVNAISIWPNIQFVHSVEEKVEIASIEKLEKILSWILKNL
jgi:dipeptidase D